MCIRDSGGRMVKQRKRQQQALSELSELIQEDLSGISAIKIYGQEQAERKAFHKLNIRYRDAAINLAPPITVAKSISHVDLFKTYEKVNPSFRSSTILLTSIGIATLKIFTKTRQKAPNINSFL